MTSGPGSHHPDHASLHPGLISSSCSPGLLAGPTELRPATSRWLQLPGSGTFPWFCLDMHRQPNLQLYVRGFLAIDRGHSSQPAHCLVMTLLQVLPRLMWAACGLLSTPQASPNSAYAQSLWRAQNLRHNQGQRGSVLCIQAFCRKHPSALETSARVESQPGVPAVLWNTLKSPETPRLSSSSCGLQWWARFLLRLPLRSPAPQSQPKPQMEYKLP